MINIRSKYFFSSQKFLNVHQKIYHYNFQFFKSNIDFLDLIIDYSSNVL